MIPKTTSPLAEAIELMTNAARAHLDGPCAFAQDAATRLSQPIYDAETAAKDLNGYGVRAVQAWWAGAFAWFDAMAVLSEPPAVVHHFDVTFPALAEPSTAEVFSSTWTWMLGPEPPGVTFTILPKSQFPTVFPAGTTGLRIRVTPVVLEPSWTVELKFTPVSGAKPTSAFCSLDLVTEVP